MVKDQIEIILSEVRDKETNKLEGYGWGNVFWGRGKANAKYDAREFQRFVNKPPEAIKEACISNGRLKHIINEEHFDRSFLEDICKTAHAARRISKAEDDIEGKTLEELSKPPILTCLSNKSVLNFFRQPSSRTFLSFGEAENHLGLRKQSIRDIRTSSQVKGESEKDSFRTFSSYVDVITYRHPSNYADLFALWVMELAHREIHILNGGSGQKRHPTQGVLDYYTIGESFNYDINGLSVIYVGDCLRGRTVHSLAKILSLHKNISAYFVAPDPLQIDSETEEYISKRGTKVHRVTEGSLKDVIRKVGGKFVVYMTRIQDEHDQDKQGDGNYNPDYLFNPETLEFMPEKGSAMMGVIDHDPDSAIHDRGILMHPMPKREEISPEFDYMKEDSRVLYWRQQRNGMWARVALLAHVFGVDDKIRDYYRRNKDRIEDTIKRIKVA